MNTTTKTRTRVAQIAAHIDLDEKANARTLDDLLADDRVLVDVWTDDEPDVVLLGEQAAVVLHTVDVDGALMLVEARLRRGWGREGEVPESIEVQRYDGECAAVGNMVATVFAERLREPFATWRLIDETVHA